MGGKSLDHVGMYISMVDMIVSFLFLQSTLMFIMLVVNFGINY